MGEERYRFVLEQADMPIAVPWHVDGGEPLPGKVERQPIGVLVQERVDVLIQLMVEGDVSRMGNAIGRPMTTTDLASGKIAWGQKSFGIQGSKGGLSHLSTGAIPIIGMSKEAHFLRSCSFSLVFIVD